MLAVGCIVGGSNVLSYAVVLGIAANADDRDGRSILQVGRERTANWIDVGIKLFGQLPVDDRNFPRGFRIPGVEAAASDQWNAHGQEEPFAYQVELCPPLLETCLT